MAGVMHYGEPTIVGKRFTKGEINRYDADRSTKYTCTCGEVIGFQFQDFERHLKNDFSNLNSADFVGASAGMSFLDFYCPSCQSPTTIQYSLSAGGQHGESWFTIENVVEGRNA